MSINQPQPKKVTYAEYLTWPDEPRYEIINGNPSIYKLHLRDITNAL